MQIENLHVTVIQSDLLWENKVANLELFEEKIKQITSPCDLVVLPEMFSTGFSMNPESFAETMADKTVERIQKWAKTYNKSIVGSCIIQENGHYYNRFIWADPTGALFHYDKKHLFTFAGENLVYSPGENPLIVELKGWKIACFICYDLRFPEWSRNHHEKYDAAIYVANWPAVRSHAWKSLTTARAIENQCYLIGCNRVGTDGLGAQYSGDSIILDPFGSALASALPFENNSISAALNKNILQSYRKTFPVLKDIKP